MSLDENGACVFSRERLGRQGFQASQETTGSKETRYTTGQPQPPTARGRREAGAVGCRGLAVDASIHRTDGWIDGWINGWMD